jgi:hypothetical protein
LNFLVRSSAPRGSSLRNLKDFAPHSRETVIARCFPSASSAPVPSFRQRAITAVCSESPYALATLRVSRFPILWLGARCKGIARFAALRLDTCSLRREEVAMISREEICRSQKRGKRFGATHQTAATAQQREPSFYTPRRDSGPPLDSWARSSTNPSTVDDFAARASARLASDSPDLHSGVFSK